MITFSRRNCCGTKSGNIDGAMIAPDDQMFVAGQEAHYFSVGEDGLNNVLASLVRSRCQKVEQILDLPCGHGRVARHLRAGFQTQRSPFLRHRRRRG